MLSQAADSKSRTNGSTSTNVTVTPLASNTPFTVIHCKTGDHLQSVSSSPQTNRPSLITGENPTTLSGVVSNSMDTQLSNIFLAMHTFTVQ